MSEQAPNSPSAHDQAAQGVESLMSRMMGEPPKEDAPETVDEQDSEELAPVEGQETEQQGQEPPPPQSEVAEVEIDGETYQVPEKIKDRFIQHADYTRKTQDLAELRRVQLAEREASTLERGFGQSVAAERQQLALIDAQIAQYKGVDWSSMGTDDLVRTRTQLDQLKEARAELDQTITAKRGDFDGKIKAATQEAMAAGMKYIQQHIKGFDQAAGQKLIEYGQTEGYLPDELTRITDPRIVVSLWKASQWDALKASQPGINKRAASTAPVVRPGAIQNRPSRVTQLNQAVNQAKSPKAKAAAMEDYFAARLGGGR